MKPFGEGTWGVLMKIKNTHPLLFSPILLLGIYLKYSYLYTKLHALFVTEKKWEKMECLLQGSKQIIMVYSHSKAAPSKMVSSTPTLTVK